MGSSQRAAFFQPPRVRARIGRTMTGYRHPVLDLPLGEVMRPQIALPLQFVLKLHTVGNLLAAWRNPKNHESIERVFDSPQQARHAVATCAAWLGIKTLAQADVVPAWWVGDDLPQAAIAEGL